MNSNKRRKKTAPRGVFARGNKLYVKLKLPTGKWKDVATGLEVGQERDAAKLRQLMQADIERGAVLSLSPGQAPTLGEFFEWWIEQRKADGMRSWDDARSRIETHVLDLLRSRPLDEIKPLELKRVFDRMRARGKAPKTVWNTYSAVRALYASAKLYDFVQYTPCVLTEKELGPMVDADPEWRPTALYERAEIAAMIFDERIPDDRRVYNAVKYLGGCRLGEVSGLRVRNINLERKPLGSMVIATSYGRGRTKTNVTKEIPIHPVLQDLLVWWLGEGFEAFMGRVPVDDDFVIPRPPKCSSRFGPCRDKNYVHKQFKKDLETLGFRHRRVHDLRRSFITHAIDDGADPEVIKRLTHPSAKRADAFALYNSYPWARYCEELAKIKVEVPEADDEDQADDHVAALPAAVGGDTHPTAGVQRPPTTLAAVPDPEPDTAASRAGAPTFAAVHAATKEKAQENPGLEWWRRRESKGLLRWVAARIRTISGSRTAIDRYGLVAPDGPR